MVRVSRRQVAYWICLGVYVIGIVSYLAGLGAFTQFTETTETADGADDVAVEYYGKETVMPEQPTPFDDQSSTLILGMFSPLDWVKIVLGLLSISGSTFLIREIELNPEFLRA